MLFIELVTAALTLASTLGFLPGSESSSPPAEPIRVKFTQDFQLSGNSQSTHWQATSWVTLSPEDAANQLETKFKVLYSKTGIYFLFDSQDERLTASKSTDFDKLWLEDVVEVFLWPDSSQTIYFEYELSPLNYELPILIPNINGKFLGWRPWLYEDARKTRHLTNVVGGKKQSGSAIKGWQAEFFIPYELLAPLANVPPRAGSVWKANMYRVDYDHHKTVEWSWQKTEKTFHEFRKFGRIIFE